MKSSVNALADYECVNKDIEPQWLMQLQYLPANEVNVLPCHREFNATIMNISSPPHPQHCFLLLLPRIALRFASIDSV